MKKTVKRFKQFTRAYRLFILNHAYYHHTHMKIASYALKTPPRTWEDAEQTASLFNEFYESDLKPDDLIKSEKDYVEDAISSYDRFQEWLKMAGNSKFIEPVVVKEFCQQVDHSEKLNPFKNIGYLFYRHYFTGLIRYIGYDISKAEFENVFFETSPFSRDAHSQNIQFFKKSITEIEKLVNKIEKQLNIDFEKYSPQKLLEA